MGKRHPNLGQSWYHTKSKAGVKTSRWRYSKVAHIAEKEGDTHAYCGLSLDKAARAYSEEAIQDNTLDYYTSRNVTICKKCESHPNFGLLLLGTV
jgi:hypothetical protein